MLQTSVDVWYISLSLGLLILIGFISYVLLNVGRLISDFRLTVDEFNHKLEMLDETINLANDSFRLANDSLRNIHELLDSMIRVMTEAGVEMKKMLGVVSNLGTFISGITSSLSLFSKKKKGK